MVTRSHQVGYRLINSKFPPVSLFDDVADEEDFEFAFELQSLTNPRLLTELGDLSILPLSQIPFGIEGVNYATAPFTHVTEDGSRFSDGSFGVLYMAETVNAGISETRYHTENYFRNVQDLKYDTIDMRCLKVTFSAELIDGKSESAIHDPNDYSYSRGFGKKAYKDKRAGIEYNSVREDAAVCWALFSPQYVEEVVQTRHFEYKFDGEAIVTVRELVLE
ncbi:RES family NAD+ phosphorylase [uncultured Umboniibacter sp.]|uniref:RES family NAD+ phosphorylase n=1 Tax=uncultured Umboniibacter sp. TaxID=1798917 RepID=UPI00262CC0B6|nr:RES family NAD+ phosphorylase [uncultured Umboniibacter sp.]